MPQTSVVIFHATKGLQCYIVSLAAYSLYFSLLLCSSVCSYTIEHLIARCFGWKNILIYWVF